MKLHFKAEEPVEGYHIIASPDNSPLRWQTFGLLRLPGAGKTYETKLVQEEAMLSLLYGVGSVRIQEESGKSVSYHVGPRIDPFTQRATVVHVPPGAQVQVVSESSDFQAAIYTAPSSADTPAFVIEPGTIASESTGVLNWRRDVCIATSPEMPVDRFILGETINPPGNWSSYPPHKHDEDRPPFEAPYEEVYHFLFKPRQGFGFIRVYDPVGRDDRIDEALLLQHGDTVVLPRGYHPLVAAPGYQVCYLFSLVGESRQYGAWSDDPDHTWLRACEAVVRSG